MAKHWVRLWLDMPTDPKFRTIARKSGQPLALVIAVYCYMLTIAANAAVPGTIEGMVLEDAASAMDCEECAIDAIVSAMQGKVLEGYHLTGWAKRQPEREDNSRDRVARHREAKKHGSKPEAVTHGNAPVTHGNAPDTDTDTDTDLERSLKDHSNSLKNKVVDSGATSTVSTRGEAAADVHFAKKMFNDVLTRYPKSKPPVFDGWARDIRLMREADKRDMATIVAVWEFAQTKSDFWADNCRSPKSLRKNFEKIDLQRLRETTKKDPFNQTQAFLARYNWLTVATHAKNKHSGEIYDLKRDYGYGHKAYWGKPGLINRNNDGDRIDADSLEAITHGN